MKIIAALQARMGSTRLPGKMMKPVLNEPLIYRLFERVNAAKTIDQTVITSTTDILDQELALFGEKNSIGVFRGAVDDIVSRFYDTAKHFEADAIVRIWGDCPFVDPRIIDRAVKAFKEKELDYLNTFFPEKTFPLGLDFEIYHISAFQKILEATDSAYYREFPVEYIKANPSSFKTDSIQYHTKMDHIHLTVDYQVDLDLTERLFEALYPINPIFSLEEIIEYIDANPDILIDSSTKERNSDFKTKQQQQL
jgi:spore coat polysaccharide biosynthesis protein SpsF